MLLNSGDLTLVKPTDSDTTIVAIADLNGEEMSIQIAQKGLIVRRTIKDEADVAVDISGYETKEFLLRAPGGTNKTKTASFTTDGVNGQMEFITVATDFDEAGTWQIQAHLASATDDYYSAIATIQVIANLTA